VTRSPEGDPAIAQLPSTLQRWLMLERFHLYNPHIFQNPQRDPNFDTSYLPQNSSPFLIPCFFVPRRCLHVLSARHDDIFFNHGDGSDADLLFPIHPSAVSHYEPFLRSVGARDASSQGIRVWAVPTSSTRTLLAWPDMQPHRAVFIKTSLHSEILGSRRILRANAARSVGQWSLVNAEAGELPKMLAYLPETLAFTARQPPYTGAIVRSIPSEIMQGRISLAPLFSLIGGSDQHSPLLPIMLPQTGMQAEEFVHRILCEPFAQLWVELSLKFGLIIEPHAQNLLLELSSDGCLRGRLWYRDFEGLHVDWDLRRRSGRPSPSDMPNAASWRDTYGTYGRSNLLAAKWHISLAHYLYVLREIECALRSWRDRGVIGGPSIWEGGVTMMFSRCLFLALERLYDKKLGEPYDLHRSLKRFLILLAKLQKDAADSPYHSPAGLRE
jgi:hypothetical protein